MHCTWTSKFLSQSLADSSPTLCQFMSKAFGHYSAQQLTFTIQIREDLEWMQLQVHPTFKMTILTIFWLLCT